MVALVVGLLLQPAEASRLFVGGAAGLETGVDQVWAGVDVSLWGSRDAGFEPVGKLAGGVHGDLGPIATLEAGFAVRVPEDEAIVRAGLLGRVIYAQDSSTFPFELTSGDPRMGLVPAGLGFFEFEFEPKPDTAVYVGFKGGLGSRPTNVLCDTDEPPIDCLEWGTGFHGGFYARAALPKGLAGEVIFGTTVQISIGKAF